MANGAGAVGALKLVRNRLVASATGTIQAQATEQTEELPVGLVFRSVVIAACRCPACLRRQVGRRARTRRGGCSIREQAPAGRRVHGRLDQAGPTGVIGTNKPDALRPVTAMVEDAAAGRTLAPAEPDRAAAERVLRQRQPRVIGYAEWLRLKRPGDRARAGARPAPR
jgi:ferredoxin--NADP+ reductase